MKLSQYVYLITIQEKKAGEGVEEKKENESNEEKSNENIIVIKVDMHCQCEACAKKIFRSLKAYQGMPSLLILYLLVITIISFNLI